MDTVLCTGASGFIGKTLLDTLILKNYKVRAVLRQNKRLNLSPEHIYLIDNIDQKNDWSKALHNVKTVVHLAARVHIMNDIATDPLSVFRKINVEGTLNLANQAAKFGVQRFIFLSSVKVNGEFTHPLKPFREDDTPNPQDPYAISKYEAEQGLLEIAQKTGMEIVIIRPPLIYGPGVKANFLKMMECLYRGIPLPFGAINNQRSLLALDNLVNLIILCIDHVAAANEIFLAADGKDISTSELLLKLAHFLGRPARLISVPQNLLESTLTILRKKRLATKLCCSLQVDISKAKSILNWTPPISLDEGLEKTATWFLQTQARVNK